MNINITDQIVSQFLSGLIVVLVLIAVGGVLATVLGGMAKKSPFTRLALVLALSPLSLVSFLGYKESTYAFIYAMIAILIGLTIDGIHYLLQPKAQPRQNAGYPPEKAEEKASDPNMIVWEKAE